MTDTRTSIVPRRLTALGLAALLGLGSVTGIAACSDEDGDGGETDEEIKDIEEGVDEGVDDAKEEVDEETDALNEGDNENDD